VKTGAQRTTFSAAAISYCAAAAACKLAEGRGAKAHRYGIAATAMFLFPTLLPNCGWWGPVIRRFQTTEREVWLTIDDGPDPIDTPEILEVLARHEARATFFVIGRKVERFPELAHLIVRSGHQLANHTWSHPAFSFWSATPRRAWLEIARCSDSIRAATNEIPTLFRAPAGLANPWVHWAAKKSGLPMVGWSAAGQDGIRHDPRRVIERICKNVRPGSIILLHEGSVPAMPRGTRAKTLETLLLELRQRNLQTLKNDSFRSFT